MPEQIPEILIGAAAGILLGIPTGVSVPTAGEWLIHYKERKRNKTLERWNESILERISYVLLLSAAWCMGFMYFPFPYAVFIGLLAIFACIVAYIDNRCRIIPNELVFLLLVTGIIYQLVSAGMEGIWGSAIAFLLTLAVVFVSMLLAKGKMGMGAGDTKLLLAAAVFTGFPGVTDALFYMAAALGVYCITGLVSKRLHLTTRFPMGGFIVFGLTASLYSEAIFELLKWLLK